MKTKLSKIQEFYIKGDYKSALRIASKFFTGLTSEQKAIITRAYECHVRPEFYEQLGYEPEVCIRLGIEAIEALYIKRS